MTNKFIEQRVDELEKEVSELKMIVAQIRKPSTVVEEALANVGNIIEFEGKQYKKVDREAREGDVVILRGDKLPGWFTKRMKYKVESNEQIMDSDGEMQCVYNPAADRTPETVDVYELIPSFGTNEGQDLESEYAEQVKQEVQHQTVPCSAAKSPNQLRAEIIEKAKGFVDSLFKKHWNRSGDLVVAKDGLLYDVQFVIKKNEKQVNVLLRVYGTKDRPHVDINGKAKCNPSDVFNEHIGKAIALGRALGLDVSEFEQAVQPNEVVVGQIVRNIWGNLENQVYTVTESYENHTTLSVGYVKSQGSDYEIINDTNAIYGGGE